MDLWIYIALSLLFSAFFSGMEIAFITANKLQIELDSKQGSLVGKINSFFIENPSRFIATMLIGNNIALVVYGMLMAKALTPILGKMPQIQSNEMLMLTAQTIISTLIVLITAEFLPKALFRINPNKLLNFFSFPVTVIFVILSPIVYFINGISNIFLKYVFQVDIEDDKPVFAKVDIDNYLEEVTRQNTTSEKELDHEIQIFKNALDFSNIKARECMVPRTEIVAIDVDESIDKLKNLFTETGLSKILVYRETIDNIIGYAHLYEMFKRPKEIKNILLPITIVPESMPVNEVLSKLIEQRRSIAVVVDEFGGTSGIITTEDIIEEIFGEIEDEHDKENLTEEKIDDKTYRFSARLEIDYLNEKYNLQLPESDEYETLGGMLLQEFGTIPNIKDRIKIRNYEIIIDEVEANKIDTVVLKILD
ncbi:MAG TPA: hemolysin [Flavobacteriales bacterium]|nr:hemolysin [Flavobacteriales bacterium]|tara:strand:- start:34849 stop:36114 length:1266 start_codon:yes stop_codon:yes gene_type:complete